MKLTIEIDLDNAVFAENGADEVERILCDVASRLPDPLDQTGGELSLHDANGNYVGFARIDDETERCIDCGGTNIVEQTCLDCEARDCADQHKADARLIAAAPDLLAACQWAMKYLQEARRATTTADAATPLALAISALHNAVKASGGQVED